jgi:alkylation response protein AidB-like acyl-CoA dehydrogenase
MISHCEANQAWLENITYQMTLMPYKQQSTHLAGPIGLLKMFATRSAHECADEAVQIFGGRALTQTGMGRTIEMFHRTYKFDAILGGAEGKPCSDFMGGVTDVRSQRSWGILEFDKH